MALMGDTLNKKKNTFDLKKQWISELLEKTLWRPGIRIEEKVVNLM